jgi:hypothetical protein
MRRTKRRGAHVVALENSSEQLATARMLQEGFDLRFPLGLAMLSVRPVWTVGVASGAVVAALFAYALMAWRRTSDQRIA